MNSQTIKEFARELGADLVGIGSVDRWDNAPRMLRPQAHMAGAKSVVVMGIHHPDASVEWGGLPTSNQAGPFQIGMIPKLDMISRMLARFIEETGAKAIPYPCTGFWRHRPYKEITSTHTASFSHRHAAVACGLGEFGWNNMFLSPQFGPRQRLVSVITDLELQADPLYNGEPLCDRCNMCASKCPGCNYDDEHLLDCGRDIVRIADKTYEYAKLNRWRCLWGEQFAFDMNELKNHTVREESDLYRAADAGVERKGGEFGNCLRYCMAKPVRYWDRATTSAPRRRKTKNARSTDELITNILSLARKNGADRIDIRPLSGIGNDGLKLIQDYPMDKMRQHFSWVISLRHKIPSYPKGHSALTDNENYLKAALKVQLSIAAYDIAAYLDNLGYEAMQDWTGMGDLVFAAAADDLDTTTTIYQYADGETPPPSLPERYKLAASTAAGVQRESQSMTAGAQNDSTERDTKELFVSCAVICDATLQDYHDKILPEQSPEQFIDTISSTRRAQQIAVAPIEAFDGLPGTMNLRKALPGAKSVVALLAEIPRHIAETAGKQEAECATTYSYLQYETLRELIWAADNLTQTLEHMGARALPLADVSLDSIRTLAPYWEFSWSKLGHPDPRASAPAAAAVGLGEIGKSGMLLAPSIGPNHKIVFVVTDAKLEEQTPYQGEDLCLNCGKCATTCPVQALRTIEEQISIVDRAHKRYTRNEIACEWARSLGMVSAEGTSLIGWQSPDHPLPQDLSIEAAQQALESKDPLQVKGYLYPCQVDTLAEPCIVNCPAR